MLSGRVYQVMDSNSIERETEERKKKITFTVPT